MLFEMRKLSAVVLDLTGHAMEWLDNYADEKLLEICEILTLDESSPIPIYELNNYDNWDILFVFENGVRDRVSHLLDRIGIPYSKIIYPLDIEGSLYDRRDIASLFLKNTTMRLLEYISCRKSDERYSMVSAENLSYINVSSDNTILPGMITTKKNWAKDDMKLFYELSRQYFVFDKRQRFFCDIGANIGTTCIYFKKNLDKDVKIMAFEPSSENYKLLKINLLLNDIDPIDNFISNIGLSDKSEDAIINYNPQNPGGSSFVNNFSEMKEDVKLVSFDEYLKDNSICPEELKYLWIDVEGYEARFLVGARKTLSKINAPIFMEFIPRFYQDKEGEFDLLLSELKAHFKYFINAGQPEIGKLPIEMLRNEQHNNSLSCDLFLLKE